MATKILLVEDYLIQSMGLGNLLQFWGYDMCKQVAPGEDTVEKAEEEKPDVILMDMNPEGDKSGIEAAREIRSRFGIPVIFTAAFPDDDTLASIKDADYFVRPLDLYKLKSIIDSIVTPNAANPDFSHSPAHS